jgi:hypothetical protein
LAELRTVNPLVVGSSPTLGAIKGKNMPEFYTPHIFKQFIGKRIELVSCQDPYTTLTPGIQGVVDHIDNTGTIFVNWENGSCLGLIPGIDKWKYA